MTADTQAKLDHYLTTDTDLRAIYHYTRRRFDAATDLTAHNWDHIYRDTLAAIIIGEAEKADMTIVLPAMVVHDIGFIYGATGKTHGQIGADRLAHYLGDGHIEIAPSKLAHIADCIRTHKASMHGVEPQTLEAKVVADADLLDKFGPVGVYQAIRVAVEFKLEVSDIIHRLTDRDRLYFLTPTGDRLATPAQRDYVKTFGQDLARAYQPYQTEDPS